VASTLVYFFSKGQCPIIDWRVISTLKNNGYNEQLKKIYLNNNKIKKSHQIYLDNNGWDNFFDLCPKIVRDLDIKKNRTDTPLRVLDKALWKYQDLNKMKLEKEPCL